MLLNPFRLKLVTSKWAKLWIISFWSCWLTLDLCSFGRLERPFLNLSAI